MNYIYYFKNFQDEIIYVGRTNNIKRRMKEHFVNGHLLKECYNEVCTVMYSKVNDSKYDTEICETLMINKYKPKYNTEKVFNEQSNKTTFKLIDLNFEEIYIYFLDDKFCVDLNKPCYPWYSNYESIKDRCNYFMDYNLGNLKHRMGLYKNLTNNIYKDNRYIYDVIVTVYKKIKKNICYKESNLDEPISDNGDLELSYVSFNIKILDELNLSSKDLALLISAGFIFKVSNDIYAVPLHTKNVLNTINNNFL